MKLCLFFVFNGQVSGYPGGKPIEPINNNINIKNKAYSL